MKKKIYFADLMYDTGLLSCDYFPLGCGYVAAYAKSRFSSSCDVEIFKYVGRLLSLAEKEPPDIFAGSCYAWNKNLVLLVSGIIKKQNPKCLIVLGGPAFPLDKKRQKEFLSKNRHVDFFIPFDGELAFANLLEHYFSVECDAEKMKKSAAQGIICLDERGEVGYGGRVKRPVNLDIFPSPYLTGLFDKFFDEKKFTPLVQTTRGCPFTCAYCWASNKENRSIGFFSLDRVNEELRYVTKKATKNNMYDLVLCDSNFGLYKQNYEVTNTIYHLQQEYDYPRIFTVPFAKEAGAEYAQYFSKLKGVTYCLSVQSTDPTILENIKRKKVDLNKITENINMVHAMGKYIGTEIITGLPYETRETHMRTLRDLIDCGFDLIGPFTFMLLDGIELDSEEAHKKFRYDIRYRMIPRDFGKIKDKYCFEIERVVVGTDKYNFDDYIYFRGFHGLLRTLFNNDIYKELIEYVRLHNIHLLDWITYIFNDLTKRSSEAAKCFNMYVKEAHSELWDSPRQLMEHYSKEENFKKLVTREEGDNLMQKQTVVSSTIYYGIYVYYFTRITGEYLANKFKAKKESKLQETNDIGKLVFAKLSNVFTKKIQKKVSFSVRHDILKWIENGYKKPLEFYRMAKPEVINMELTEDQISLINSVFKRYDVDEKNPYGLYRTFPLVRTDNYFRKIRYYSDNKETELPVGVKL